MLPAVLHEALPLVANWDEVNLSQQQTQRERERARGRWVSYQVLQTVMM